MAWNKISFGKRALFRCAAFILVLTPANAIAQTLDLGRFESGHYTLDVSIDGGEPQLFILDTGASHTAISQPLAEAIGFVSTRVESDPVQALTRMFDAERFVIENMSIEGQPPLTVNAVIIPLLPGQSGRVAGLLGADVMSSNTYSIDFARAELDLDANALVHRDGNYDSELNLLIGYASLFGRINNINVMIDSGSSHTLVNSALGARVRRSMGGILVRQVGGVSNIDTEEAIPVILRGLHIGGLCVARIGALRADLDIFRALGWEDTPSIIIGLDVLAEAKITVDRQAGAFQIGSDRSRRACTLDRVQRDENAHHAMIAESAPTR